MAPGYFARTLSFARLRALSNGKTLASQAKNGGSIPPARSDRRFLPGLLGAAVRAADGGRDVRLERVAAHAGVEGTVLGPAGTARGADLAGLGSRLAADVSSVLGGAALGQAGREVHEPCTRDNARLLDWFRRGPSQYL